MSIEHSITLEVSVPGGCHALSDDDFQNVFPLVDDRYSLIFQGGEGFRLFFVSEGDRGQIIQKAITDIKALLQGAEVVEAAN